LRESDTEDELQLTPVFQARQATPTESPPTDPPPSPAEVLPPAESPVSFPQLLPTDSPAGQPLPTTLAADIAD
jgi:hypothetical protein